MRFLCIVFLLISSAYAKEVLRHVHVIYRHGDRAPESIIKDSKTANIWPHGLGQLTANGIRQQFALGQWLRLRYKDFLNVNYLHSEIYVRSTDIDRTLMSAQANLAGLYYNSTENIIPKIPWRPIPVHTVPKKFETFMFPFKCKAFNKRLAEMYQSERYKSSFKVFEETLKIMRKASNNSNLNFQDTYSVYDNLYCEHYHNVSMAPWITKDVYDNITKVYGINWKMMFDGQEFGRLSGGRFLDEITTKMTKFANDEGHGSEKVTMFSGHDTNMAALLSALGIGDGSPPPYAACLMIELFYKPANHTEELNNWIVKIYFKTGLNESPVTIPDVKLPGCRSQPCTLHDFIEYVKPRSLDEVTYKNICVASSSGHSFGNYITIYGLFTTVALFYRYIDIMK